MSFLVLDTDVASASPARALDDPLRARLTGETWCISFVTVGELSTWTVLRSWGPRKLAELADWRQHVVTLAYSDLWRFAGVSCRHARSSEAAPGP